MEQSAKGMAGKTTQSGYREPVNLHDNLSKYALYGYKLNTLSSFLSMPHTIKSWAWLPAHSSHCKLPGQKIKARRTTAKGSEAQSCSLEDH